MFQYKNAFFLPWKIHKTTPVLIATRCRHTAASSQFLPMTTGILSSHSGAVKAMPFSIWFTAPPVYLASSFCSGEVNLLKALVGSLATGLDPRSVVTPTHSRNAISASWSYTRLRF